MVGFQLQNKYHSEQISWENRQIWRGDHVVIVCVCVWGRESMRDNQSQPQQRQNLDVFLIYAELFEFVEKQKYWVWPWVRTESSFQVLRDTVHKVQCDLVMSHYVQFFPIYLKTRVFNLIPVANRDYTVKGKIRKAYLQIWMDGFSIYRWCSSCFFFSFFTFAWLIGQSFMNSLRRIPQGNFILYDYITTGKWLD